MCLAIWCQLLKLKADWWLHRMNFETLSCVTDTLNSRGRTLILIFFVLAEPYLGNTPLLGKTDDFIYFSGHFGSHLGFWWPNCNTNFSIDFPALDNPYNVVLGDSLVRLD